MDAVGTSDSDARRDAASTSQRTIVGNCGEQDHGLSAWSSVSTLNGSSSGSRCVSKDVEDDSGHGSGDSSDDDSNGSSDGQDIDAESVNVADSSARSYAASQAVNDLLVVWQGMYGRSSCTPELRRHLEDHSTTPPYNTGGTYTNPYALCTDTAHEIGVTLVTGTALSYSSTMMQTKDNDG